MEGVSFTEEGLFKMMHKGYQGTVEYSLQEDCWCGVVLDTPGYVAKYEVKSWNDLNAEFKLAVEEYLEEKDTIRVTKIA